MEIVHPIMFATGAKFEFLTMMTTSVICVVSLECLALGELLQPHDCWVSEDGFEVTCMRVQYFNGLANEIL